MTARRTSNKTAPAVKAEAKTSAPARKAPARKAAAPKANPKATAKAPAAKATLPSRRIVSDAEVSAWITEAVAAAAKDGRKVSTSGLIKAYRGEGLKCEHSRFAALFAAVKA